MKTKPFILNDEDADTIYNLVTEFFGVLKADAVFFELTQPE